MSSTAPSVSTNNWDTVYVINLATLNTIISETFPSNFSYSDAVGAQISGTWADWSISATTTAKVGQQGQTIEMTCSTGSTNCTAADSSLGLTSDLTDATIVIQFSLDTVNGGVPVSDPTTSDPGTPVSQIYPTDSTSSPISVVSCNFPHAEKSLLTTGLQAIFADYFNANLSQVKAVFSVTNIGGEALNSQWQWLKPSATSYALSSPDKNPTLENSLYAVLAITDQGTITSQGAVVDPDILNGLPAGANAAFVISQNKVAQHLLMGAAQCTIQGSQLTDYELTEDGNGVTNKNKVKWGNFEVDVGTISPNIAPGNFILTTQDDSIVMSITDAEYSPSLGLKAYISVQLSFALNGVQPEGSDSYVFVPDTSKFGSPKIVVNVEQSEGMMIAELVLSVVATVCSFLAGASSIAESMAAGAAVDTSGALGTGTVGSDTIANSISENPADFLQAQTDAAPEADEGVSNPANAGQTQSKSIFASAMFRGVCGISGAIAGLTNIGMTVSATIADADYKNLPDIKKFAANALDASPWPNLPSTTLVGAGLRDSLVIALKVG